jgi:hypothetical protein
MPETIFMAKEMGKSLGRSEVLFGAMQKNQKNLIFILLKIIYVLYLKKFYNLDFIVKMRKVKIHIKIQKRESNIPIP